MSVFSFEIGADFGSLVNVETLTAEPNMSPASRYLAYAELATMASGDVIGRGSPVAVWSWGYIKADFFAALRAICPGASADVTIRTLIADYATYQYFTAKMVWPSLDSYEYKNGKYTPFEIRFTNLEIYT